MNNHYQRKFHPQAPQQPVQPATRHRRAGRKQPRRKFSLLKTVLMLIGAVTLFVLLMRYAIVPLLVMLPQWLGGAA